MAQTSQDLPKKDYINQVLLLLTTALAGKVLMDATAAYKGFIIGGIVLINIVYLLWRRTPTLSAEQQRRVLVNRISKELKKERMNVAESTPAGILPVRKTWYGRTTTVVDPTETMVDIYNEVGASLLILGEPGSGKSVTVLDLAQEFMSRAVQSDNEPLPIELNLSAWASNASTFKDWIADQLRFRYGVKKKTGLELLDTHGLVLLLDGLDEVNERDRPACVDGINEFIKTVEAAGIVVACRSEAYRGIGREVGVNGKIVLEPLSSEQVDSELSKRGFIELISVLNTDPELRKLSESPWMLNLMIGGDVSVEGFLELEHAGFLQRPSLRTVNGGPEVYRRSLFNLYIARQLRREPEHKRAYASTLIKGLGWLAGKTTEHSGGQFIVERLQPRWLIKREQLNNKYKLLPYIITSRVSAATMVMLTGVLMMWFSRAMGWLLAFGERDLGPRPVLALLNVEQGLVIWLAITAGIGGATMAVLDFTLSAIRTKQSLEPSKLRRGLIDAFSIVVNVLGFGIVFLLAAWLLMDLKKGIYGGLVYGIAFGLVVAVRGRNRTLIEDIDRAQEVGWSLLGSVRGFFLGFVVAALLSLSSGLVISTISGRTLALRLGIVVSLSGAIVGAIVFGLRRVSVEDVGVANEGVSQWAKNTLMVSLYVGLPLILLFWFYTGRYIESHRAALETGLFFGLVVGMLAGCLFGGLDLIYHFVLRFLLWLDGFPTLRFATFLAYSTHLAFLREVGGSYEFRHLSLRDHFAELSDTDEQTINTNLDGGNATSVMPDVVNRSEKMQGPRSPQPLCEAVR